MAKFCVALHNYLSRDNRHMSRDKHFLPQTLSHRTATLILTYKGLKCIYFQSPRFSGHSAIFVSVQYRKILHTCITLTYMAIYFSHTITMRNHVSA